MIWIPIAVMTAGAVLAVLWPLSRRVRELGASNDVAVYKDQLEEIARDQNWGLIAPPEADAARVEVSRRLIAAAARSEAPVAAASPRRRRMVAGVALVAMPVLAIAMYLAVGSPDLPGQPLATRLAQAHGGEQSVEALFARVEQHLQQNPNDGRGWEVIAPVYMRLGRYDDAVKAWRNALRLLGETAERESDLGEALVALQSGVVTDEAKAAFDHALRIDPTDVTAQFYRGLAAEQDGRKDDAARIWRALVAAAPPGAEWVPSVQRALARVEGSATASAAPPASAPAAQNVMIRGMVERLAARLQQDGSDVDGWIALVRSYTMLNEPDKARAAGDDARRALAGDADKLARLEVGIKQVAGGAAALANDTAASAAPATSPPSHDQSIDSLVARLAARLQRDGSDVDGWIQLVRSYTVLNQPERAQAASDDARHALAGDPDKLARLEAGIKQIAAQRAAAASDASPSTPAAAPAAPAAPQQSQDEMIRGMVDRLAVRLHQDGSDVDGWLRLLRSYMVLGDADKARAAAADARAALRDDPDKLRRLEEGAKSLGVDG